MERNLSNIKSQALVVLLSVLMLFGLGLTTSSGSASNNKSISTEVVAKTKFRHKRSALLFTKALSRSVAFTEEFFFTRLADHHKRVNLAQQQSTVHPLSKIYKSGFHFKVPASKEDSAFL